MWRWHIRAGELWHDDTLVGSGYSGASGHWKNNPDCQAEHNIGPIPEGFYTIEKPAFLHSSKGPVVMRLAPDAENEMHGRAGFLFHGDSIRKAGSASEGCIILARPVRQMLADSEDVRLQVVR